MGNTDDAIYYWRLSLSLIDPKFENDFAKVIVNNRAFQNDPGLDNIHPFMSSYEFLPYNIINVADHIVACFDPEEKLIDPESVVSLYQNRHLNICTCFITKQMCSLYR